jgi:hypothetical protein
LAVGGKTAVDLISTRTLWSTIRSTRWVLNTEPLIQNGHHHFLLHNSRPFDELPFECFSVHVLQEAEAKGFVYLKERANHVACRLPLE